jgi:hypothetical protein
MQIEKSIKECITKDHGSCIEDMAHAKFYGQQ